MDNWKIGFHKAVIDAIVRNGSEVAKDANYYNWQKWNSNARNIINSVGIDYTKTTYAESDWYEFMGTFYEGDTRKVGIDATIVLLDGTSYHWRLDQRIAEFIYSVIND